MVKRFAFAASVLLALAACQDDSRSTRHLAPIPPSTVALMASKGMSQSDPIVIRSYKRESEMEIWKRGSDGRYALLKTYPICRWSGQLGPKVREGDRQAPEGFYAITPAQMNPSSSYYLSFDTGYPNTYDRVYGRTGSHLMVHGSCSSRGCFAMTDEAIAEVYAIAREAFAGGQRSFQFQSYPFRMSPKNLAQHRYDPNITFWRNLKEGSDYFEVVRDEPKVAVCGGRYVFGGSDVAQGSCSPIIDPAVAEKRRSDEQQVAALVASGIPAVKLVYDDGGQHASFREVSGGESDSPLIVAARENSRLGDVSRPDGLAAGPTEILLDSAGRAKPAPTAPAALAYASQRPASKEAQLVKSGAPARLETPAPQPAATSAIEPAEKSLYQRILSGIGLFSSSSAGDEAQHAVPRPPAGPVTPRRGASTSSSPQAAKGGAAQVASAASVN